MVSVEELGGADKVIQLIVPPGIGDISWIYSKICHLSKAAGMPVLLFAPQEYPPRAGDFVPLLPEVYWGGYLEGISSWEVITQALPDNWRLCLGMTPFLPNPPGRRVMVSANLHLELGRTLEAWLPMLPTNYHYSLAIPEAEKLQADVLLNAFSAPRIAVYTSSLNMEMNSGGWNLWSISHWGNFLDRIGKHCLGASFIFLGAEYDRDKTQAVAQILQDKGYPVCQIIGFPLGVALHALQRCHYCFAYPSGIGIMANVLRTPGIMLLPWSIEDLKKSYADPLDLKSRRYRVWPSPGQEDVIHWFLNFSMPQILAENGGQWPEK
jgi:hypothetical protein